MCDRWHEEKRAYKRWARHWTHDDMKQRKKNHLRHCFECTGYQPPTGLPRDPEQRPQED